MLKVRYVREMADILYARALAKLPISSKENPKAILNADEIRGFLYALEIVQQNQELDPSCLPPEEDDEEGDDEDDNEEEEEKPKKKKSKKKSKKGKKHRDDDADDDDEAKDSSEDDDSDDIDD